MTKQITSKDNKIFKQALLLTQKKYRDKYGMYLIEGENLIDEAIKNKVDIKTILVREDKKYNFDIKDDNKIFSLSEKLFDRISDTKTSQGVIAIVAKQSFDSKAFTKNGSNGNFLVLDRLQDPGNIGTIIRTADATGYELVIAMKGTADIFSQKVVRSTTGSLFRVPIIYIDTVSELLEFTAKAGKKLVATCFDTDCYYYDVDLSKNIALVIGNEGNGISKELIDKSDIKIKIPMQGNIESLNASVAAGILMYEAVRPQNK